MDIDEVADELYEVAPEEFVAVRSARQDEAKAEGDKALAKLIGSLPKPSTAAWVCNLLVRAHREEIEGLVELGTLLREAQENLAGDELKALNRQRGQLISALTRQAATLARERGHAVSTSMSTQVEETLRAAMADPDSGEAVLSGRLTSALSYSGLGTGRRPDLRVVRPPAAQAPPRRVSTCVERAAGKYVRAAEERRRRRALDHEDFGAAGRVAQERERRGRPCDLRHQVVRAARSLSFCDLIIARILSQSASVSLSSER